MRSLLRFPAKLKLKSEDRRSEEVEFTRVIGRLSCLSLLSILTIVILHGHIDGKINQKFYKNALHY